MGIRGKFLVVIAVIGVAVTLGTYVILEKSHRSLIEMEAVRIAEIVSTQVVNDRAEYTQNLVGKLTKDGYGASRDAAGKPGFIQLPAQFVRNVAQRVKRQAGGLYSYSLISLWNLNPDQGLKDDFDRWAWEKLAVQDKAFVAGEPGAAGYPWRPVYRFETVNGAPLLRYAKADPASAPPCVICHNNYEQQEDVKSLRRSAGVEQGKSWKLHQLMGAIRVEIPVQQVAAMAAAGRNQSLAALAGIFVVGFGLLGGVLFRSIIRPVEVSVREVEGFSEKVDSVVGCSKDLVMEAEQQSRACGEATSASRSGAGDISQSLASLAAAASKNAMRAEDSAVYCYQLQESFSGLKSRLLGILGK